MCETDRQTDRHKAKMKTIMFLPPLLLQLEVMMMMLIAPVTSRLNSVTVMSYMKGRKVLGGEVTEVLYVCLGHLA